MNTGSLTVMFEDPFWIGLFEQTDHEEKTDTMKVLVITSPSIWLSQQLCVPSQRLTNKKR